MQEERATTPFMVELVMTAFMVLLGYHLAPMILARMFCMVEMAMTALMVERAAIL
jgi:hypothetical protein